MSGTWQENTLGEGHQQEKYLTEFINKNLEVNHVQRASPEDHTINVRHTRSLLVIM